jgi:phosphomannomutase
VMITGSHNPAEDNGFKVMIGDQTLHGPTIPKGRAIIEPGSLENISLPAVRYWHGQTLELVP